MRFSGARAALGSRPPFCTVFCTFYRPRQVFKDTPLQRVWQGGVARRVMGCMASPAPRLFLPDAVGDDVDLAQIDNPQILRTGWGGSRRQAWLNFSSRSLDDPTQLVVTQRNCSRIVIANKSPASGGGVGWNPRLDHPHISPHTLAAVAAKRRALPHGEGHSTGRVLSPDLFHPHL